MQTNCAQEVMPAAASAALVLFGHGVCNRSYARRRPGSDQRAPQTLERQGQLRIGGPLVKDAGHLGDRDREMPVQLLKRVFGEELLDQPTERHRRLYV